MESRPKLLTVLREGNEALARADAALLSELAEHAAEARLPETREEWDAARRLHRALDRLLLLTRRNLRLLGSAQTPEYDSTSDGR